MANFDRICLQCGTTFTHWTHNGFVRKYCSRACRAVGAGASISVAKRMSPRGLRAQRTLRKDGYYAVTIPHGHVSRTAKTRKRADRSMEHQMIAEGVLGRPLKRGEVVHHINCDRSDNRNSNLLICSRSYHVWLHGEMSRRYAREKFGRVA